MSAIQRTLGSGLKVRRTLTKRAAALAFEHRDRELREAVKMVIEQQGLQNFFAYHSAREHVRSYHREKMRQPPGPANAASSTRASSSSSRIGKLLNADVWSPSIAQQQREQQQQPLQSQQREQQQGEQQQHRLQPQRSQQQQQQQQVEEEDSIRSSRAHLRDIFGISDPNTQ